jgi:hypothetical protein
MKRTDNQRYEDMAMGLKVRESCENDEYGIKESMQRLAELIEMGYCRQSYKFYQSMDTFVQEFIPEEVTVELLKKAAKRKALGSAL